MAVLLVTLVDPTELQAHWLCPDCKRDPGPLEPQDEFVWRRPGMTRFDALAKMVKEHQRTHRDATIVWAERRYLEFEHR